MPATKTDNLQREAKTYRAAEHAALDSYASHSTTRTAPRRAMSTTRYVLLSGAMSVVTFQGLWWTLAAYSDETPWLASSVAAGVMLLACMVAREIRLRSVERQAVRAHRAALPRTNNYQSKTRLGYTATLTAATSAIRKLERRLREIERGGASAVEHLEAYKLCEQYLKSADETLPTLGIGTEVRAAVRAGQERVRVLRRKHLLLWARKESQSLLSNAQSRVRDEDKIEGAQAALTVINEALAIYPDETDLQDSARAVREFVASTNVARWITLAERAEFKGEIETAINHYNDALFDLSRADISNDVRATAAKSLMTRLQLLEAHRATTHPTAAELLARDVVEES